MEVKKYWSRQKSLKQKKKDKEMKNKKWMSETETEFNLVSIICEEVHRLYIKSGIPSNNKFVKFMIFGKFVKIF